MCGKPRQKLAVNLAIVSHAQRLAGLPFLIHRYKDGKLLVSITSDKLFHIAAAPPCAWGFARILAKPCCSAFIASLSVGPLRAGYCQPVIGMQDGILGRFRGWECDP